MYEFIEAEIQNDVALITLNRPDKRNALTRAFIGELNQFVEEVKANSNVRLLVLKAKGSVFCAGMDLSEMKERARADDPEKEWQHDSEIYNRLVSSLFALPIPTLAVLQGPVLAGGTGMVFACDLVIASDKAFVSLPEPKRGIVAAMVAPLLVYRAGMSTASWLLFSGKPLAANEALRRGLFHEVVDEDSLESATTSLINSILTGSHAALQSTKTHLKQVADVDVLRQIGESTEVSAEARRSPDAQEGLAAFAEKRNPNWQIEFK